MNFFTQRAALVCAALLLSPILTGRGAVFAQTPPASATIVDLGTLSGEYSYGYGVSENGNVTGRATLGADDYYHAFLYTGGHMMDLGTLGGTNSIGNAVNDLGAVTGTSAVASNSSYAFLYQHGTLTVINPFHGISSEGYGINSNATVVGSYYKFIGNYGTTLAFEKTLGQAHKLSDLGGHYTSAAAINDSGITVGASALPNNYYHAVRYEQGQLMELGTLGGKYSSASAISQDGKITGTSSLAGDTVSHAFLYENGHMTDLGSPEKSSSGTGVNDLGQVVGSYSNRYNSARFLWQDGKMINLNKVLPPNSGWTLMDARGITNSGYITGYGIHQGHGHAYLLQLPAGFAP